MDPVTRLPPSQPEHLLVWRICPQRFFLLAGGGWMAIHAAIALYFSVDMPHYDEWEYFAPHALADRLDLAWLFSLHNEHRLVFTKALAWLLLRTTHLFLPIQVGFNLAIYGLLCGLLLRFLRREFELRADWLLFAMGCALPWDVHGWSFQTHFPLYMLFFWVGLLLLRRVDARSWGVVPISICCVYTFAAGVFCAGATVVAALILAVRRPQARRRHCVQAMLILAGAVSWLFGFQRNPGHPSLAMPWDGPFWQHLCGNVGRGLGYDCDVAVIAGALALGVLCGLALRHVFAAAQRRGTPEAWLLVAVYLVAVFASVSATAMARAGFGMRSACASRYTETVLLSLPFLWLLISEAVQLRWLRIIAAGVLLLPYVNEMDLVKVYAREHDTREAARACVRKYYAGRGTGDCPGTYPANIASRLQRAREMGVAFATDAVASER